MSHPQADGRRNQLEKQILGMKRGLILGKLLCVYSSGALSHLGGERRAVVHGIAALWTGILFSYSSRIFAVVGH